MRLLGGFRFRRTVTRMRTFIAVACAVLVSVGVLGFAGVRAVTPDRQYLSALTADVSTAGDLAGDSSPGVEPAGTTSTGSPVEPVMEISAPPAPQGRVMNILVIGSDSREGTGNAYGTTAGQRSDSTMIVQVNPYSKVTKVVSIPRDLWVRMPECAGGQRTRFNTAYSRGGPNCTLMMVRILTGLKFDHVVVMDFNAFKKAVEVLGGVPVCLARPLDDKLANLQLPAGQIVLTPEQALALARSRHSTDAGSDLARIGRQQYLLQRIASESVERASDPVTAFRMLHALQPNLVVDQNFDTWTMAYLALEAAGNKIASTTFPWKITQSTLSGAVFIDVPRARELIISLKNPESAPAEPAGPGDPTSVLAPVPAASTDPAAGLDPVPASSAVASGGGELLSSTAELAIDGVPCVS